MRGFEKALKKKIRSELPFLSDITPGIVIEVFSRGKIRAHLRVGKTFEYYDIASLTKIIFTATAWMDWVSKADFDLKLPVYYFLNWWKYRATRIDQLMHHNAGLVWWVPYYKRLKGPLEPNHRWPQLIRFLKNQRPKVSKKSVYSDVDLFMLGFLLEELEQKSLIDIWRRLKERLHLSQTDFHWGNVPLHPRKLYAPTEACAWRGQILQGEVHDENAWALGGVAPHSGLFSNAHDLGKWGLTLRQALRGETDVLGEPKVVSEFVKRQANDWGHLFMKPSRVSSAGKYFSKSSFGHTGFTGTSLWMDPVKDLLVVILSNRIHPTRANNAFVELRPKLHDWICELL